MRLLARLRCEVWLICKVSVRLQAEWRIHTYYTSPKCHSGSRLHTLCNSRNKEAARSRIIDHVAVSTQVVLSMARLWVPN